MGNSDNRGWPHNTVWLNITAPLITTGAILIYLKVVRSCFFSNILFFLNMKCRDLFVSYRLEFPQESLTFWTAYNRNMFHYLNFVRNLNISFLVYITEWGYIDFNLFFFFFFLFIFLFYIAFCKLNVSWTPEQKICYNLKKLKMHNIFQFTRHVSANLCHLQLWKVVTIWIY